MGLLCEGHAAGDAQPTLPLAKAHTIHYRTGYSCRQPVCKARHWAQARLDTGIARPALGPAGAVGICGQLWRQLLLCGMWRACPAHEGPWGLMQSLCTSTSHAHQTQALCFVPSAASVQILVCLTREPDAVALKQAQLLTVSWGSPALQAHGSCLAAGTHCSALCSLHPPRANSEPGSTYALLARKPRTVTCPLSDAHALYSAAIGSQAVHTLMPCGIRDLADH